ncbi:MAG: hypothetical protein J6X00_01175 [Clostridia bacterium]|nr:hypothetical protein [Clostridia bacterium]
MSAFKKVMLTESEVAEDEPSVVEKQTNSFDTDYTDKKLNDLYKEFDSITLDETDLSEGTLSEVKAKSHVSAQVVVRVGAAVLIAALLVFLAIYNIFVISNYKQSINIINSDIAAQETQLNEAVARYNELTDTENIEVELVNEGYGDVSGVTKVKVSMPKTHKVQEYDSSSNWWDNFCNFIANMFGR